MSAGGDAGFSFGDSAIDYLNGAAAVAAFVVLGSFQSGFGFAQMRERGPHVGLIRPNGLKTHGRDQCHQNQTCFQCFHDATCNGPRRDAASKKEESKIREASDE
jgi:hypothetical protein